MNATSPTSLPQTGTIVSSHATSEGLVVYYRQADGSLSVVIEPRRVMPKRVLLRAS